MSKIILSKNVDVSGNFTTLNLIAGKPTVLNQSVINPLTGQFSKAYQSNLQYPERFTEQTGNLYVENNLQTNGECDCQDLVINSKGSLVPRDNDMFVRGNLQTQPGSIQKCALGFEGGSYYTNLPFGTKEYKTQVFDDAGPVTRQLIPKALRPLNDPSQNIILCIVDGMGKNQEWQAKVVNDMIKKYGNYMNSDVSDNELNYNANTIDGSGSITASSSVTDTKLSWEEYSNTRMDLDPVCAEMYWNNEKNYLGVNPSRNGVIFKKFVNDNGGYIVPDSAATGSQMATGRLTQNEIINTVTDVDSTAFDKPSIVPPQGLHSKVMTTYTTIFEEAKANNKLTCIASTSNMLHATPASFVSKSNHRDNYTDLIRTCFGPGGVNPNLILGPIPNSGNDRHPTLLDTSSVQIGNPVTNSGITTSGAGVYNFPEIELDKAYWDASSIPYRYEPSTGRYWASAIAYARRYGYTVLNNYNDIMAYNTPITINSKIWFADNNGFTPAYIANNTQPLASDGVSRISKYFLRPVNGSGATPTGHKAYLTQKEKVKKAIDLLKTGPSGFIMMHEDSETDWGGHAGNFISAAFETLEGSKAMRDAVYNSDVSSNTTIITTPDHECGGWTFADASGILDMNDSRIALYPQEFYNNYKSFETLTKMHFATNFLSTDFTLNVSTVANVDSSAVSIVNPYYNIISKSYNDLSGSAVFTSNALRIKQGALDNSALSYPTDISGISDYKAWLGSVFGTTNALNVIPERCLAIVKDASNSSGVYCRTMIDESGNLLLVRPSIRFTGSGTSSKAALDASRNDVFTLNGSVTVTLRLPVSALGKWSIDATINDTSMNTITQSLLKNTYDNNRLYNTFMVGFGNDSSDITKLTMSNALLNAELSVSSGSSTVKNSVHSIDLCSYIKMLNGNKEIVRHYQAMYFDVADDEFISKNRNGGGGTNYSHSDSICECWIKSSKLYDNTYANLGINAWGGSGTKPSDFLHNKSISSMGIYKLMTGTI